MLQLSACMGTSAQEPACFIDYEPEPEPAPLYPNPTQCDPRVAPARSPRIQPPVLIGEHANGTTYVVDRLDAGYHWVEKPWAQDLRPRLFVSSGKRLIQHDGSAGVGSAFTYAWGGFGSRDGSVRGSDRLDRHRNRTHVDPADTKMALWESEPQHSYDDLRRDGLSEDEIHARLFEEQTPLRVRSECAVQLVTGPPRLFDGYDFKVFYGPPDHVAEYPTAEPITRKKDGTTTIRFEIDGAPVELYFPVNRLLGGDRKPRVTLPEQTLALTLLSGIGPARELPEGMTYVCHDQEYSL